MSRYVKMNYKGDPLYEKQLWKCDQCCKMSSENHVIWRSGFSHLRENKDLNNDKDLCQYLHDVNLLRAKNEGTKK